ncbi:MAG: D-alanine--D-alanine ligase [Pseudomonadales bacterium]|jgi:D-alanine-D-alanine ligase|nr:D-alanine--D-alanine ligase [Pseudomonadales bacterium]MDP6471337.1 D-alanine--D-alanine ligase [Pseudomonadales bacterium]MDP6826472.1 D-alanine--D-alanine ligase [Pseudomonadales bacterium]MDP6970073.1 D-alanine--D-alanine ligase [Pseudomonadales bacterium]
MTDRLSVAVLMGGPSAEAGVSRNSAREVVAGLQSAGHAATRVELDHEAALGLLELNPDVVFPALHGPPGEDGTVQGFLELLGFAYVGSGVHGSAVAMDKSIAKMLFRGAGLPVADEVIVGPSERPAQAAHRVSEHLGDRVVIKPLNQGSAIGVTRLANGGDLSAPIAQAQTYGSVLVEPFIMGREITVGVFDPHDPEGRSLRAFPVIEICTAADQWYDFENRYKAGASEHLIPAPLDAQVNERLQEIAMRAHSALGLRDLSRADFLVTDSHEIFLLEVNTLPGMTPTSLYPDGAAALGMDFPTLMDRLVLSAVARASLQD